MKLYNDKIQIYDIDYNYRNYLFKFDKKVNIKHPRERDSSAYIECVRELTNNVKKAFVNKPIEA